MSRRVEQAEATAETKNASLAHDIQQVAHDTWYMPSRQVGALAQSGRFDMNGWQCWFGHWHGADMAAWVIVLGRGRLGWLEGLVGLDGSRAWMARGLGRLGWLEGLVGLDGSDWPQSVVQQQC